MKYKVKIGLKKYVTISNICGTCFIDLEVGWWKMCGKC
jgi:hypothetical protein